MKKPYLIGITGGSGSGKTTFVNSLKVAFGSEQICFISQDDYYHPKEKQKEDDKGVINFDLPKSIDKKAFLQDIECLREGGKVYRMEYTFNNKEKKAKQLEFHSAPIIIVEGIFIFHFKKIRKLLDLKVYLHAKENLKVIRRIKRDRVERNYPLDDVLYRYEKHVLPTFERYIRPYMDQADLIVNNNEGFHAGLDVLIGFLDGKLKENK